jgi:hypothetical protein
MSHLSSQEQIVICAAIARIVTLHSPSQFENLAIRHALKPVLRLPATRLPHAVDIAGLRAAHAHADFSKNP